jgi:hypothetical protein
MRLYISSGKHLWTDVEGRVSKINQELPEIDHIFVENREETPDKVVQSGLIAPFILSFVSVWFLILRIFSPLLRGDQQIIDRLEEQHDIEATPVDESIINIIQRNRYHWFMSNWLITLPIILFLNASPNIPSDFGQIWLATLSTLVASVILAFVGGINMGRDLYMAKEIAEYA